MLNSLQERELCYLVKVDDVLPMNADKLECARIGGWNCVVGKGEFKPGDIGVYFEIDSKCPDVEPFASMDFLRSKKFAIKTQKIRGVASQGLLMPVSAFGMTIDGDVVYDGKRALRVDDESRFLTKRLGVTYAVSEDNARKAKANKNAKYDSMVARHPKIFKIKFFRKLMKHGWGRKLLYLFLGRKKKDDHGWPMWVRKTDEERIENCTFYLSQKDKKWVVTEKIDGTSTTFTMKKGRFGKKNLYVCSRNVCFETAEKPCYYEDNVYWEMAKKYDIYNVLSSLIDELEVDWVTIQGETYGASVQKNDYDMKARDFMAFNLVTPEGRVGTLKMHTILREYGVPCVPILDEAFILPDTVEELRTYVHNEVSTVNHKMKEGIVCRSLDGAESFKCVDPEYLMKWHQ